MSQVAKKTSSTSNGHSKMEFESDKPNNTVSDERNCEQKQQHPSLTSQDHNLTNSATPQSSSSTISTTSTPSKTSSQSTHTTTMGKFKEKRPGPLNLKRNLNQEIPLDLSVKSAGNVPSETLGNIFNLTNVNQMTTLETPRIIWQDNETLLIKPRLFSSMTSKASQKLQLSSLVDDSPPITPHMPFLDMICSPIARSANMIHDFSPSYHTHLSAQLQYKQQHRFKLEDNLLANKLAHTNRFLLHQLKGNETTIKAPRRSCSTESLSALSRNSQFFRLFRYQQQQQSNDGRKSSISPLVTKNLSNSCNKFSYSGQQTSICNSDDNNSRKHTPSPIISTTSRSQSSDTTQTGNGQVLTPTSVANATANLFNIRLNSPTNQMSSAASLLPPCDNTIRPIPSLPSLNDLLAGHNKFTGEHNLDPLISAAYCHQQQQQQNQSQSLMASSLTSASSISCLADSYNDRNGLIPSYLQQLSQTSVSNSIHSLCCSTLNTPTLVSPSQLKTPSNCFLPSPTLSPSMSSVFELPSPLLLFPPTASINQSTNQSSQPVFVASSINDCGNSAYRGSSSKIHQTDNISSATTPVKHIDHINNKNEESTASIRRQLVSALPASNCDIAFNAPNTKPAAMSQDSTVSENKLVHLVTSARDKVGTSVLGDDDELDTEVGMEIEQDAKFEFSNLNAKAAFDKQLPMANQQIRPATVIPRIVVSNCLLKQRQKQQQQSLIQNQCNNGIYQWQQSYDGDQQSVKTSCKFYGESSMISQYHQLDFNGNLPLRQQQQHHHQPQQHRSQRDTVCKRALSPQSFGARVSLYHNERLASCSAPPDVYQGRARPKIKSATDLCANLSPVEPTASVHCNRQPHQLQQHQFQFQQQQHQHLSQSSHQSHIHKTNAPYPEQQTRWLPAHPDNSLASNQSYSIQDRLFDNDCRPSSAEPQSSQFPSSNLIIEPQQQHQCGQQTESGAISSQHLSSSIGCNFSQSAQHLHLGSVDQFGKPYQPQAGFNMIWQHRPQSISVGELSRYPASPTCQSSYVGEQLERQQRISPPSGLTTANNLGTHNYQFPSSVTELDNLLQQSPISVHIGGSTLASNQSVARGQQQQHASMAETGSVATMRYLANECHLRDLSTDDSGLHGLRMPKSAESADFSYRCNSNNSTNSSSSTKKYHCDQCSKAFTRSDMLTRHKRLHSGDRPFQCSECKQEFSRSDHLSTHMRTHTGEKPYKCKLCSYSACRKDMITRHMKVHNRNGSPSSQRIELARLELN